MKLTGEALRRVLDEYREKIRRTKLTEAEINDFLQSVSKRLFAYCAGFPEDTEFHYRIRIRFMRIILHIQIPGKKKDLSEDDGFSREEDTDKTISALKLSSFRESPYFYFLGKNNLYFATPTVLIRRQTIFSNPLISAVVIGIAAGLVCSLLPGNISGFLVRDIASPVLNIIIRLITGIMGPIIFVSLVTAISTMDSLSKLSRLGSKLFGRFIRIAILLTAAAMAVSMVVFTLSRGNVDTAFSPRMIVDMLLSIIPQGLITPFVENNFPQLLVLGVLMGIALLLIGKKVRVLNSFLIDLRDWLNELLRLVLKAVPIIPALSLFRIVVQREFSALISGWKYLVVVYACMILILLLKILKVKIRIKGFRVSAFMRTIGPTVKHAFLSGSEIATVRKLYETAENELCIDTGFTRLWIPLNQVMLSPIAPVYYVAAPCFVAEITGTPVSVAFLFVLFLLTAELAMAYPGHIAGITTIFSALGLSADYIGLFSAYSILVKNAAAAYGITFRLLEITEITAGNGSPSL